MVACRMVEFPIVCQKCKRLHWPQYPCHEAGWEDEDGWNVRPLGVPLQVKHVAQVKHDEPVQVKHGGPHRFTLHEAKQCGGLGGLKGGPARALVLSKKERSDIARKAALTRWGKKT